MVSKAESPRKVSGWKSGCSAKKSESTGFKEEESLMDLSSSGKSDFFSTVAWYSERENWEKLNAFGMVKKTLEMPDGSRMEEERYYICGIAEDVKVFERAARGHWGIENGLHWQLYFTFKDDKNTSMAKTGARNLQIMKKIALV